MPNSDEVVLLHFEEEGEGLAVCLNFGDTKDYFYHMVQFGRAIYDKNGDRIYNKRKLCDLLYPVGSIVLRCDNWYPDQFFSGTWVRISDRILRAVGTTGTIGAEGSLDSGGAGGRTYIDIAAWRRVE